MSAADSILDDVAFLARSEYRLAVLTALVEREQTRSELLEDVDASRVTLGRTLAELEERHWVKQDGRRYRTTPTGALVAEEFERLLDTVRGERRVRDILQWFPIEEIGFDLELITELEVAVASRTDPTLPVRRASAWLETADRVRAVTHQVAHASFEAMHRRTVNGDQRFEVVMTPNTIDTLATDPDLSPLFEEMLDAESVAFYETDGPVPVVLFLTGDEMGFGLTDDDGVPKALLRSDAPDVHEWAIEAYESVLADAERVDPAVYTP